MRLQTLFAASLLVAAGCREAPMKARVQVVGGNAEQGPEMLQGYGCVTCHVIPGVSTATGTVGPPLTNYADRTFIAGRLRNEPENLVFWIRYPQRVRPGTAMPDLGVTDSAARDIAAYLYTLSSNAGGPPYVLPEKLRPVH